MTSAIRVLDDAFDLAELGSLYRALAPLPRMPAGLLYVPLPDFERLTRGDAAMRAALEAYLPRELVAFLPGYVAKAAALAPPAEAICGIEVFLSQHASPEPAKHAGLHVDSNEPDWESARVSWGSILHVGPKDILGGGGTAFYPHLPVPEAILARCFAPNTFESLDALTTEWEVVERKQNRLLAFDGRLPHYAARCQARPEEPRVALIVTGWATVPRFAQEGGFSKLSPAEYRAFIEEPEANLGIARAHHDLGRALGEPRLTALDAAMRKVLVM